MDTQSFTPVSSLFGGILIGLSAALLYLANGRIAGISGIAGGALSAPEPDRTWRWLFLAGFFVGGALLRVVMPGAWGAPLPVPIVITALAGLLVGVGTRLGNGCTSGHGVCGLSRRSPRSLSAVMVFMGVAGVTVFAMRAMGVTS